MTDAVLFVLFLQVIGCIPLAALNGRRHGLLTVALSLPVGCAIWILCALALLTLRIQLGPVSTGIVSACLSLAFLPFARRRIGMIHVAIILTGLLLIASLPRFVTTMAWTTDSLFMVLMGEDILREGSLSPVISDWYLTSYPLAVPLLAIQGLASDPPRLPLVLTVLPVSLTLLVINAATPAHCRHRILAAIAAIAAMATIFLSAQGAMQAIYVNGHVLTACLIVGFFSVPEGEPRLSSCIRTLLAAGVVVCRAEGILIAILMLTLEPMPVSSPWRRLLPTTVVALVATFSLGFVAFNPAAVPDILTPRLAWMLIAIGWINVLIILAVYGFDEGWLFQKMTVLTLAAGIGLSILLFVFKPVHMALVAYNIGCNMLFGGGWGIVWPAVLFAVIVVARSHRSAMLEDKRIVFAASYLLLLFCLGALYDRPYTIGPYDSGNRLLLHALPLLVGALIAHAMSLPKVQLATNRKNV